MYSTFHANNVIDASEIRFRTQKFMTQCNHVKKLILLSGFKIFMPINDADDGNEFRNHSTSHFVST
jgi:hypothetical protein